MRTRVKICGITRVEDALAVEHAGADAIGLVFYPKSPRYVSAEQARQIRFAVPPFISVVGLFMNAEQAFVQEILQQVPLDILQFHGTESAEDCRRYGLPYVKALGIGKASGDDTRFFSAAASYHDATALLVDSHAPGAAGGTGEVFDWSRIDKSLPKPLILAGGLQPQNVAKAIASIRPWAVDLSSGVESSPGIKDPAKIEALMKEVARVDNSH